MSLSTICSESIIVRYALCALSYLNEADIEKHKVWASCVKKQPTLWRFKGGMMSCQSSCLGSVVSSILQPPLFTVHQFFNGDLQPVIKYHVSVQYSTCSWQFIGIGNCYQQPGCCNNPKGQITENMSLYLPETSLKKLFLYLSSCRVR